MALENTDTWRSIPPEEKVELLARAQSKGFLAALLTVIVGGTIAMALHIGAVLWVALVLAPFIFQFAAGKAWRGFRPRLILEYLACRSAARRFAFSSGSKDLSATLIFRGTISRVFEQNQLDDEMNAAVDNNLETAVWIALFRDTVIMLTERPGGAILTLSTQINDKLKVESSDNGGYTSTKELMLTVRDKMGFDNRFRLTSRYPAALAVFEKRLLQYQNEIRTRIEREIKMLQGEVDLQDPLDLGFDR